MNKNELKEGIIHSLKTKGIAYTYTNTGREDDRVLINPDWVALHSNPMCIIDINDNVVAINKQPLVFKNRLVAEGALMTLQLIYPQEASAFIIDEYSNDRKVNEFKVGK